MNGELMAPVGGRPPAPPPQRAPEGQLSSPPCRSGLIETIVYLGTIGPELSRVEAAEAFDAAEPIVQKTVEGTTEATAEDCAACLEGLGIKCPGKAVTLEEARFLTRLKSLPPLEGRKLMKVVKQEGSLSDPQNKLVIEALDLVGFRQYASLKRTTPPSFTQESIIVKDLRDPKLIEKDILSSDKREDRPPCAGTLAAYFKACRKTVAKWVQDGHRRQVQDWTRRKPANLEVHADLYALGLEQAKDAQPEHCAACLGENCPFKNGVPGKEAFEELEGEISIEGEKSKPLDRVYSVLSGVPKRLLAGPPDPRLVWAKIQEKLSNLANKHKPGDFEDF